MTHIGTSMFWHANRHPSRTNGTQASNTRPEARDAANRDNVPAPNLARDTFTPSSSRVVDAGLPIVEQETSFGDSLRLALGLPEEDRGRPATPLASRPTVTFSTSGTGPLHEAPVIAEPETTRPVSPQRPVQDPPPPGGFRRHLSRLTTAMRSLVPQSGSTARAATVPDRKDLLRQKRREGTTHDALTRGVLRDLPSLTDLHGTERNDTIAQHFEVLLEALPRGDFQRAELARTASAFLDPSDADSQAQARNRLAQAALGAGEGTPAQPRLDAVLGTEDEVRTAVVNTMPKWMAGVPAGQLDGLLARLPDSIANAEGRHQLRDQATRFIASRENRGADNRSRLPQGLDWLHQYFEGQRVINQYRRQLSQGCNRLLPDELARLASDLKALKSARTGRSTHDLRPDFIRFLERLFSTRDRRDGTPAVYSRDRLEILLNLLHQPVTDDHALQNKVLDFAVRQTVARGLTQEHRAELLKALLQAAPGYGNSRVAMLDHQGRAIGGLSLRNLPASRAAEVMAETLHQLPHLSTHRSHAGHQPQSLPGLFRFGAEQLFGALLSYGAFNVGNAAVGLIGSSSPAMQGVRMVGRGLSSMLRIGTEADTAASMLPVVNMLLNQPPDLRSARLGSKLHRKALDGLVRGGLPFGLTPERRAQLIEAGIGAEPGRRTEIARELQTVADGRGIGRNPVTRQAAARYLHHLIEAGGHQLSAGDVQQARATILAAFRRNVSGDHGHDSSALMGALLAEIPPRSSPQHDAALAGELSTRIMQGIARPDAMAEAIGPVTCSYDSLPARNRREITAALDQAVPRNPAQRGRAAQRQQLPVKAVLALSSFVGQDPVPLVDDIALPMFARLNDDYRATAFNLLFDGFAEAPPTGQRAVAHFVGRLDNPNQFIDGMRQMARRVFADEEARERTDPQALDHGIAVLCNRLPRLDDALVSEALRGIVEGNPELPVPVLEIVLGQSHRADAATLGELLTNVVNSLPMREPDEVDALKASLEQLSQRLHDKPQARGTLHAFMKAADLRPRRPESILQPEEHEQLASRLPGLIPSVANRALDDITRAGWSPDVSQRMAKGVLAGYGRATTDGRSKALRFAYPNDPGRALATLAARTGLPEPGNGRPVRPKPSDQFVPLPQGGEASLQQLLKEQPADVVQAALESLAENYFLPMPDGHLGEIAEILRVRGPELQAAQQQRLAQTLVLASGKQLADDEIQRLGGDPTHPAWRFPGQIKRHERQDLLKALRESREQDPNQWPTPAGSPSSGTMPFVKREAGTASAPSHEARRHSTGLFHRGSQGRRGSMSSGGGTDA